MCSKTSSSSINLYKDSIFSKYECNVPTLVCKVPTKPLANMLKNIKKLTQLDIFIENPSVTHMHEVSFVLASEHLIVKTHRYFYQDAEPLHAVFHDEGCAWVSTVPKTLLTLFDYMKLAVEVTVQLSCSEFRVRSYQQQSANSTLHRYMTSDAGVHVDAFDEAQGLSEEAKDLVFVAKEVGRPLRYL